MSVSIAAYTPGHQSQIIELISSIQRTEFGIDITPAQQPDLKSIPAFYQTGAGNFWVAVADDRVVGTIALKDIGDGGAALRKMFVAPAWRGDERGVARALLDTLLYWARSKDISDIYLGTTAQFKAAHRFYDKNGFVEVPKEALPASFPVMRVDTRFYIYGHDPICSGSRKRLKGRPIITEQMHGGKDDTGSLYCSGRGGRASPVLPCPGDVSLG